MTQAQLLTLPDTREIPGPAIRIPRHGSLVCAVMLFSAIFWAAGYRASVVIDGTRYHFLDDDQMISMRYARNLAEGHGPVWNPGERVEGYTNFGWVLVMAGVHALGAPDSTASLWIRVITWTLGVGILFLTARLLGQLGVESRIVTAGVLVTLALSFDLLFWAVNGFETPLLTLLFVLLLSRALASADRGEIGAATCFAAGLLPVIRADAVDLTAAVLLVSILLARPSRWWLVLLALIPLTAMEAFRLWYYGEWLPNTYYLKVAGRKGLLLSGAGSLKGFVAGYPAVVVLVVSAAISSVPLRVRLCCGLVGLGALRMLFTGADIYAGFRFLAPYLPVLMACAGAGIERYGGRAVMTAVLLLSTALNMGVTGRESLGSLVSANGMPHDNTVAGVMLRQQALPESRVAVFAAGCLPYFSRLRSVDMLGKTDKYVARLPERSSMTGHNRFDIDWSLQSRPDFVATTTPESWVANAEALIAAHNVDVAGDREYSLIRHPVVIAEYLSHPVSRPRNTIFVHRDSPELARVSTWREPEIRLP